MEGFRLVAPKDNGSTSSVTQQERKHIKAKAGSVDGNYKFSCKTKMGDTEGTIDFQTDGEVLSGTVQIMGMVLTICNGKANGTFFQCSVKQQKAVKVIGKVDGDTISGTIAMGPMKMSFDGQREA